MQKAYNILSVIALVGLGIWIVLLIRANAQWKALVLKPIVVSKPTTDTNTSSTETKTEVVEPQKNVTMGEMWDSLQKTVGQIKVELDLK